MSGIRKSWHNILEADENLHKMQPGIVIETIEGSEYVPAKMISLALTDIGRQAG